MYAHVEGSTAGWWAGVQDPMRAADHLLILLLVGLLGGLAVRAGRSSWTLPAVFVSGLAASGLISLTFDGRAGLQVELLGAVAALTALAFVHPRRTGLVAAVVVLSSGILLGLAHGVDAAGDRKLGYIAGFLFTVAILVTVGDIVGASIGRSLQRRRPALADPRGAQADDHVLV